MPSRMFLSSGMDHILNPLSPAMPCIPYCPGCVRENGGFVTVEMLQRGEQRGGLERLLNNVSEAKHNGVRFTPEAALYVLDAATRLAKENNR